MQWRTIDTQLQLDALAALARGEDSRVVAGGEQIRAPPLREPNDTTLTSSFRPREARSLFSS